MPPVFQTHRFLAALGLCLGLDLARAIETPQEATGVNLSLDQGFGARHQGMATRFAGFQVGADAVSNAPAGMADINDLTFSSSHTEQFAQAKMDHFAALFPIDEASTLGLAVARFGTSDNPFYTDPNAVNSVPTGYFTTADYWLTSSFARRLGPLDLGASLQLLYRDLDQTGLGMRADVMATFNWQENFRLHALLVGALPSVARWSNGYSEYEPTDLKVGAAYRVPAPYFYGNLQVAWETEGLFQVNGKSSQNLVGNRGFYHPLEALKTSDLGAEFQFDFGLSLRTGFEELELSSKLTNLWHVGLGYTWRHMVGIDYSFNSHPDLPNSQRIAVQFTPIFPHFSGKNFRSKTSERVGSKPLAQPKATEPAAEETQSGEEMLESDQGELESPK
jgi:hypothetical protein